MEPTARRRYARLSCGSVALPARDDRQREAALVSLVPAALPASPATAHANLGGTTGDLGTGRTHLPGWIWPADAICASPRCRRNPLMVSFIVSHSTNAPLTFLTTRRGLSLFQKSQIHGSSYNIRIGNRATPRRSGAKKA